MFDIGFLEIFVVLIIALLVIGPQRMPEVARKLGSFMGKTRNFINQMKQDSPLQETVNEVKDAMNLEEQKQQMTNIHKELEQGLNFNDTGIDLEDFQRPFGGDVAETSNNQFNKATPQPVRSTDNQNKQDTSAATETANPAPSVHAEAEQQTVDATPQANNQASDKQTTDTTQKS